MKEISENPPEIPLRSKSPKLSFTHRYNLICAIILSISMDLGSVGGTHVSCRIAAIKFGLISMKYCAQHDSSLSDVTITVTSRKHHGVSIHLELDCLFNRLFRLTSKKISKPASQVICERNPPVAGGFPSQGSSKAENISMTWCHYVRLWYAHRGQNILSVNLNAMNEPNLTEFRRVSDGSGWTYYISSMTISFVMHILPMISNPHFKADG